MARWPELLAALEGRAPAVPPQGDRHALESPEAAQRELRKHIFLGVRTHKHCGRRECSGDANMVADPQSHARGCSQGISPELRPAVWKYLCDYYSSWTVSTADRARIDQERR